MSGQVFVSYAQNLEDILLWRALKHVKQGRYIDIGANDPRIESVSLGFYEQGWRGVHFEPDPHVAQRLRADRPDETVHEVALSDHEGTLRFFLVPRTGLSTGVVSRSQELHSSGWQPQEHEVCLTTLKHACANLDHQVIHWMKIDVEGMEEQVLRGWNPSTLRPWIIVIEATGKTSTDLVHHPWEPLVLKAGYEFVFFDGLNRYYVASEHPELKAAFASPVNVFDLSAGGCEIHYSSPFAIGARRYYERSIFYRLKRLFQRCLQAVGLRS